MLDGRRLAGLAAGQVAGPDLEDVLAAKVIAVPSSAESNSLFGFESGRLGEWILRAKRGDFTDFGSLDIRESRGKFRCTRDVAVTLPVRRAETGTQETPPAARNPSEQVLSKQQ